jgi:hypothetical protein
VIDVEYGGDYRIERLKPGYAPGDESVARVVVGADDPEQLSRTYADRILVTVVYLRRVCSQNVLSDLLGINANSIGKRSPKPDE